MLRRLSGQASILQGIRPQCPQVTTELLKCRFLFANKSVSELGASYILLEESDDGGKTWSTAREYEGQSWMTAENRSTYSRTLSYPGTIGHQYRVTAEVFAKDANGGDSRTTPTSSVVTAKR